MSLKTYTMFRVVVVILLAFAVAWASAAGNLTVLIIAIAAASAVLITLSRRGTTELFTVGLTLAYSACLPLH